MCLGLEPRVGWASLLSCYCVHVRLPWCAAPPVQYAKFPLKLARMPRSARARRSRTLLSTLAVALVLFANAFVGCDVDYTSLLVC